MAKKKRTKRNNTHRNSLSKNNKRTIAVRTIMIDENRKGLKKATAYIHGCLGEDLLNLFTSYIVDSAIKKGCAIDTLLVWSDVHISEKPYTEEEAIYMKDRASEVVANWYNTGDKNQIEAIFLFNVYQNISLEGFYNFGGSDYFSLGCLIHPANKMAIYKPNSNELKPGIIPGYWLGGDESFLEMLSLISGYKFVFS